EGAVRYGSWLRDTITRNNLGAHWPARIPAPSDAHPPRIYGGFFHGSPGNAHFLLLLHEATGDPAWGELAREVAHTFISHGAQTEYGLNWPRLLETDELHRVQWCHGAPGVGLFYARAAEQLKDPAFLQTAEAAGETTYRAGDIRNNPGLCHGLAGNAELFLELYKITKNSLWLNRAYDFAQRALAYRTTTKNGDLWPADEPGLYSPDFLCGAAGTGYFFLQLLAPDQVRLPLL
ncbi:MAG: hypothetical protein O2954_05940, partial [bacterium]|nr:hypothetical protein [bacterium]